MKREMLWMHANECYLPTPTPIMERFQALLSECALNRYPDMMATEVAEAFRAYYTLDEVGIVCGNGSDELIDLLFRLVLSPGKTVLTLAPDFSMYGHYAKLNGVQQLVLAKNEQLQVEMPVLFEAIRATPVDMILFSNPCNPTAQGMLRQDIQALLNAFDGYLVVDEAYMDFWTESVLDLVASHPRLIVLRTASKAIGLAGLRLGFAVMAPTLAEKINREKSPYNVSVLSQALGAAAYREKEALQGQLAMLLESSKDLADCLQAFAKTMPKWRCFTGPTNFVYIEMPEAAAVAAFLEDRGIMVRAFSEPPALRFSAVNLADQERLWSALEAWKGEVDEC